ncbi:MAG: single-stranded-DNA-specific exonuclease RecJ [Betaproteobacteria bacterium]|nr:single-stranded-DNA-specific exonuclease RecJ [Betaproteobacteria bacterium]MDE2622307.1 single-stranded-DNA-specific exonuclease RecJ [Betaproteobacteria bacterium]
MSGVLWAQRPSGEGLLAPLLAAGAPPLLARVLAARGGIAEDLGDPDLAGLIPFDQLKGIDVAAGLLADAIDEGKRLLIVADYDADGATACAVGLRALRAMGAQVDYMVPNRLTLGYGLTPEVVRLALPRQPQLIVTVDNGIASVAGVAEANRLGIPVLVTDHHLPGTQLPDAAAIVNPNQPGCPFPSKCLAGVGVMFYVMMALRAELRRRGRWQHQAEPVLGALLDLVALGTVADVVRLDRNNRLLVQAGLRRIAAGRAVSGIRALYRVAERPESAARSADLGFVLGPRLNAAGRMEDMTHGIECLVSDNPSEALQHAQRLDAFNRERREVESVMQADALERLEAFDVAERYTLCLHDEAWHPGVVGILASRLKDRYHRPVIVFAPGTDEDEIRGSGRSIAGFHLRDALDQVTKREPELIRRFGGHAAAAGLTLHRTDLTRFESAFEAVARECLGPADLAEQIIHDGEPEAAEMTLPVAQALQARVWGQGFPEPLFKGRFAVIQQRVVGQRHLKLKLGHQGLVFDAILFGQAEALPQEVEMLYHLGVNEWQGVRQVQLEVRHWRV